MAAKKKAAARRSGTPAKSFNAKVKGADKWLAHDGTKFFISENKADATLFTKAYVGEIAKSNWGNEKWEADTPEAPAED